MSPQLHPSSSMVRNAGEMVELGPHHVFFPYLIRTMFRGEKGVALAKDGDLMDSGSLAPGLCPYIGCLTGASRDKNIFVRS